MSVCDRLEKCMFFKKYESEEERKFALQGFVTSYCKGTKQFDCIRKKIARTLGPEKAPANMMPNGMPLSGTTKTDWSTEVKALL